MSETRSHNVDSAQHTQWAAERALGLLRDGKLKEAIDSMVSDLSKDVTRVSEQKGMIAMMGMSLRNDPELTAQKVEEFILGFSEISQIPKERKPIPERTFGSFRSPAVESVQTRTMPEKQLPNEEEKESAEVFIENHILKNEGLTSEAKEFMVNQARTERGPWSLKEHVTKVTQQANRITIHYTNGESYYRLPV